MLDTELATTTPVVKYVEVPDGHPRVTIETEVSRVVRPKDLGADDKRELGLMVGWRFIDRRRDGN